MTGGFWPLKMPIGFATGTWSSGGRFTRMRRAIVFAACRRLQRHKRSVNSIVPQKGDPNIDPKIRWSLNGPQNGTPNFGKRPF